MSGGFTPLGWLPLGWQPSLDVTVPFVADAITTGAPVLDNPALTQVHVLAATGITTGAAVLDNPALTQLHNLTATDLDTAAAVLDSPPLTPVDDLDADDLDTGAAVLDSPPLTQVHVLLTGGGLVTTGFYPLGMWPLGLQLRSEQRVFGRNLYTLPPELDHPALTQVHHLVADDLTTGAPVLSGQILISPGGMFVKYAGVWSAPIAYAKHDGVWKDVIEVYRKNETDWELVYQREP